MLEHTDLKKGERIILDGDPYEILELNYMKKAQRRVVVQTKVKNLITGEVFERNFRQGEVFQEAEIYKFKAKFIYFHRGKYFFSKKDNPSERFDLSEEQIGFQTRFLKQGQEVEAVVFEDKIINIALPVKIELKVAESPPGIKGDRAQGGNKAVVLETGAKINVPLFIKEGDWVEVNTQSGEYVKRTKMEP